MNVIVLIEIVVIEQSLQILFEASLKTRCTKP